jgi:hypothetical protein
MPQSESGIQSAICDYLAYWKVFFWRQNTAPSVNKPKGSWSSRRMPSTRRRGDPDILQGPQVHRVEAAGGAKSSLGIAGARQLTKRRSPRRHVTLSEQ